MSSEEPSIRIPTIVWTLTLAIIIISSFYSASYIMKTSGANDELSRINGEATTHSDVLTLYQKVPVTYSGNSYRSNCYEFIFSKDNNKTVEVYSSYDAKEYVSAVVGKKYNVEIYDKKILNGFHNQDNIESIRWG